MARRRLILAGFRPPAAEFWRAMRNTLFYGDNLNVLSEHVPEKSVDLIYLDPTFNFSRNYDLFFEQEKGDGSPAQIMTFENA